MSMLAARLRRAVDRYVAALERIDEIIMTFIVKAVGIMLLLTMVFGPIYIVIHFIRKYW